MDDVLRKGRIGPPQLPSSPEAAWHALLVTVDEAPSAPVGCRRTPERIPPVLADRPGVLIAWAGRGREYAEQVARFGVKCPGERVGFERFGSKCLAGAHKSGQRRKRIVFTPAMVRTGESPPRG